MTTTIATIRDRLRIDLRDPSGSSPRWSDAALDRHIARALTELSHAVPRRLSATLATTPGSRDLSLATLEGLLEVEAAEYPAGLYPPATVPFEERDGTLTLLIDAAPTGDDATVHYRAEHTLDSEGSTVPAHFEDTLATGAAAYAALEYAGHAIDTVTTGGQSVSREYAGWGQAWRIAFRELLRQHGRGNQLRSTRLAHPA